MLLEQRARHRRHKTITDEARPRLCVLHRWLPDREPIVVGNPKHCSTHPGRKPAAILAAYLQCRQAEITFQAIHIHLGIETRHP